MESSEPASAFSNGVASVACSGTSSSVESQMALSRVLSMLVRPTWDFDRLARDGEGERARATSCAAWTIDARVATGWPYSDE